MGTVKTPLFRASLAWLVAASAVMCVLTPLHAAAQDQDPAVPATSVDRVKTQLDTPIVRTLTPSVPVQLRPVFKSGVEKHPWVQTFDQAMHKQFDLNALQRQSADWSSRCCGLNLGSIYKAVHDARQDALTRKTREQIRRELAELRAARAAAGIDK
jgi:hypothetical protein